MDAHMVCDDAVTELHSDLSRKYTIHGPTIDRIWRSFDRNQRARCMKIGTGDGAVLKHSLDSSLGNVYKIIPEWNLRDMTEGGPEFFLDFLQYRATRSLLDQYCGGVNGGPGDHAVIDEMVRTKGLRHTNPFKDCYTIFLDGQYGKSFRILAEHAETLAGLAPAIRAGLCIPQSIGELVLQRQMYLLQSLNIIIEDILEEGSKSRNRKQRPKKSEQAASTALSKLSIKEAPPVKLALPDLVASAQDQRSTLEEYLSLLSTEPVVLAHAVNIWFFSRPELVTDEKGRQLPVHTDKYISSAFFEAIHAAIRAAAIWNYICRLLELLQNSTTDKVYRAIILQEISNVCHLEYGRAQGLFTRHVQTGTGSKWFKRLSNSYDDAGNARVTMKGSPGELTRADPQLHYVLRLCQPQVTASMAVDWIKKLSDLHEAHYMEREKLQEREVDSLCDLVVIIGFIRDLSPVISMPALSRKKGQMFVSRSQELNAELSQLKTQIDLRDFAVPIDNLLEPGMAEGALRTLDQFIIEKAGSKMGFLYQDLVEECFSDLQNQYEQVKAKMDQKHAAEWKPFPVPSPEPLETRVEQRRQKEKTRQSHSSTYDIAPRAEMPPTVEEPAAPPRTLKVSSSTAQVFATLFTKSESRGSVTWAAFEGAMADLGFSVLPKFGSVYTFLPPDALGVKKSLTVHRPHKSRIEGYLIPIFARRLRNVYGWGGRHLRWREL